MTKFEEIKANPLIGPDRIGIRMASEWLRDMTPGTRRKRLFMAMLWCLHGLLHNLRR